jgi:hypothetical protein
MIKGSAKKFWISILFSNAVVVAIASISMASASMAIASVDEDFERLKQPQISCFEDLIPKMASDDECANSDGMTRSAWLSCERRAKILAEIAHPAVGLTPDDWFDLHRSIDRDLKINLIYDEAKKNDIPAPFLYAVTRLESGVTDCGVIRDGKNYSCGAGMTNLIQWCRYMKSMPTRSQVALGWPVGISCDDNNLPPELVGAIFEHMDFAKSPVRVMESKSADWQTQLTRELADNVGDEVILKDLNAMSVDLFKSTSNQDRLRAIRSYTRHCSQVQYSIPAIAYSLRDVFDRLVPKHLKEVQKYSGSERFAKKCEQPYYSSYFPINTGWLLAYAIHNGGEEISKAFRDGVVKRAGFKKSYYSPTQLFSDVTDLGFEIPACVADHALRRMTPDESDPLGFGGC